MNGRWRERVSFLPARDGRHKSRPRSAYGRRLPRSASRDRTGGFPAGFSAQRQAHYSPALDATRHRTERHRFPTALTLFQRRPLPASPRRHQTLLHHPERGAQITQTIDGRSPPAPAVPGLGFNPGVNSRAPALAATELEPSAHLNAGLAPPPNLARPSAPNAIEGWRLRDIATGLSGGMFEAIGGGRRQPSYPGAAATAAHPAKVEQTWNRGRAFLPAHRRARDSDVENLMSCLRRVLGEVGESSGDHRSPVTPSSH